MARPEADSGYRLPSLFMPMLSKRLLEDDLITRQLSDATGPRCVGEQSHDPNYSFGRPAARGACPGKLQRQQARRGWCASSAAGDRRASAAKDDHRMG